MIADAIGWKLDRITDEIKPMIAHATVSSEFLAVDAGYVSGIIQDGVGYRQGTPLITMHMEAYLGAPESYDEIRITGMPRLIHENPRRRTRRHRHRLYRRQLDSEGARRPSRAADDEGSAGALLLWRKI